MFNFKGNKHHIKYPLFWKDNANVRCHLMLAVLCCYAMTDCHELGGWGDKEGILGELKVETIPPQNAVPRSYSWKEEGATYQAVVELATMKASCMDLIGFNGVGSEGQL